MISENAIRVTSRLRRAGYEAYLVGGCVRDLLLGREPKDFDVVTNAHPEQIRAVFRNCRLIGRRFRLAHVHFGQEVIEVATFRGLAKEDTAPSGGTQAGRLSAGGMVLRDNVYGTIEEDAFRRDFTVNALYYDVDSASVIDYTGGMDDHKAAVIRLIGDPETRYREDPVRMLRAIRFAVKLGFSLHQDCAAPLARMAPLLRDIPSPRLYDEVIKLFMSGCALQTFERLRQYHLFAELFPMTERALATEQGNFPLVLLARAMENTDLRIADDKPVTPYFLFAALLWEPLRMRIAVLAAEGMNEAIAYQEAASELIARQVQHTAFPKAVGIPMREIWFLQPRLEKTQGVRPFRLLTHPRFRAAYDFLLLRAASGEADQGLADWWTRFQVAGEAEQKAMTRHERKPAGKSAAAGPRPAARKRRRRSGGRHGGDRPVPADS
ncbi:MAG: polynucleotide adenylyltransferase PcnB [Pseudomonadota bacterium]